MLAAAPGQGGLSVQSEGDVFDGRSDFLREVIDELEIDVTVWMKQDQRILDYRRLYASVRAVVESPDLFYLEELAESIASRVLDEPSVRRARVAIRKPHVAIGGPLRDVEVAIVRPRDA